MSIMFELNPVCTVGKAAFCDVAEAVGELQGVTIHGEGPTAQSMQTNRTVLYPTAQQVSSWDLDIIIMQIPKKDTVDGSTPYL